MRAWIALLAVALGLLVSVPGFAAERRIALVIGNSAYRSTDPLANPRSDAEAIGRTLAQAGFEVTLLTDLDQRGLQIAMRDFGLKAESSDVALVYYAGHGIQFDGENYLVPTDARLLRERDLLYEALPLSAVLSEVAQSRKLGLVFLDACRDNPLAERLARNTDGRHRVGAGLARVDDVPTDTLVAFATASSAVAFDGTGEHSPYTTALLSYLAEPDLELRLMLGKVRDTVLASTQGRQEPRYDGSLSGEPFYFVRRPPNQPPVVAEASVLEVMDNVESTPMAIEPPQDPEGDSLSVRIAGLPMRGEVLLGDRLVRIGETVSVADLGRLAFAPAGAKPGPAGNLAFIVQDGRGGDAGGSRAVSILSSNRPPVAVAERQVTIVPAALGMAAPTDPDGDRLTLSVSAVPRLGVVRLADRVLAVGDPLSLEDLPQLRLDVPVGASGDAGRFEVAAEDGRGGRVTSGVALRIADEPAPMVVAALPEPAAAEPAPQEPLAEPQPAPAAATEPAPATPPPPSAAAEPAPQAMPAPLAAPEPAAVPVPEPAPKPAPEPPAAVEVAALSKPAEAATRALTPTRDCEACPEMVSIPAGSFVMGRERGDPTERPARRVTIGKPFAIGRFEVTVAEWQACFDDGACKLKPPAGASPKGPMQNLSYDDAAQYAAWLSKRTGRPYRLPSEAEWEYAARGGSASSYWWGDEVGTAKANCSDCGGPWDRRRPAAAGSYAANGFGLNDTQGGVAEWVSDCWMHSHEGAPVDGSARQEKVCTSRVLRGGSWRNGKDEVTSASRLGYDGVVRYYTNGVRVVRDLD
ncbi:MAG TPA: SUMF1/EgtB/PvdO family nonheme iron enzyme [Geminicoccaceae bacterium]|nr:SUMF1/EgtB/PvdO family nonheme iron enzyme [Geminicoccus sp.]HMU48188.1 SUMF1/EgtB/PvdO family nonheme iron enzyme [Geminicoccaceae bacterium]